MLAGVFKNKPPITTVMSEPQTVTDVLPKARGGATHFYTSGVAKVGGS